MQPCAMDTHTDQVWEKKGMLVSITAKQKECLSLGESNPGLPRLSVLMTSGNHHH